MKRKIMIAGALSAAMAGICGCHSTQQTDTYAIVMKSEGNAYNERVTEGFEETITEHGGECMIVYPAYPTAEEQIIEIQELLQKQVVGISLAANDMNALQPVLQEAMEEGVQVSTLDSNTNAESRKVFVNQASSADIGETLVEAVWDIAGGEGEWAILSATSQAVNQNGWIAGMKAALTDQKYKDMRLVNIVYGDDEYETSRQKTIELLEQYPDLRVICAPTVVGIHAAAEVLQEQGSDVKVTGLGMPSQMASYIVSEAQSVCPYMYLWDPMELGQLSAYASMALVNGEITGTAGEEFKAGSMGTYRITEAEDGGTEIVAGALMMFSADNVEQWKDIF